MIIDRAKIKNAKPILDKVLEWRKKKHDYEEPVPFADDDGNMIQPLFCNKCGLSRGHKIHGS